MNVTPATTRITWAAIIASLVGPTCAVLPYTDDLSTFLSPASVFVWLLAAIGALGVGFGAFAIWRGSKVAGTVCLLSNVPVLAYWGFIAFFTAMGGGA
jgi:hypothetical protein